RHHYLPPPLPAATTTCRHHYLPPPLPAATTTCRHHCQLTTANHHTTMASAENMPTNLTSKPYKIQPASSFGRLKYARLVSIPRRSVSKGVIHAYHGA
ncbi:MAG: hypothetical protein FWD46_08260, partial [Cystobacterineae bacterium]|nr:hypothetical protein [Cystobacterineae bacterium]